MRLQNAEQVVDTVISYLSNQKHQFEMIDAGDTNAAIDDVGMIGSAAVALQESGVTSEQLDSLIHLIMTKKG